MPPFEYETEPLDEAEDVRGVFYGGRGQVGQQIVVTNRRLLLGPLSTKLAQEIDARVLNHVAPGSGDFMKSFLSGYAPMKPKTVWLRHVANVEATNKAGLFKAPGLRITTDTDEEINLGIVKSPTTWSPSPKNSPARDLAVETIAKAIEEAKARGVAPPETA